MAVVALKKKQEKPQGFSVADVLSTATKPAEPKSKSKVPVLEVGEQVRELAAKIREVKAALDSADAEFELRKQEIIDAVAPLRAELCRSGYVSSVRIPDTNGLSVSLTWGHKYTKVGMDKKDAIAGIVGDDFEDLFETKTEIKVKDGAGEDKLRELIEAVGPERFREFFDVTQVLAPTPRYTDGFFTSFTDEQRAGLEKLVVPYKPSIGVK
jgi:hypothetical protein